MLDVMFDLPTMAGEVQTVRITREVVLGEATPVLIKHERKSA